MMRITLLITLILSSVLFSRGQDSHSLRFNPEGKFKIVQFTDIHLQYDSYRSDSALVMMRTVIERERPDLVMLTGDVVGSDNRAKAWAKVAQVMIDAETPWAAMLGNHDAEYELDKDQTMDVITALPFNLTQRGPTEVAGEGNYVLPILGSASSNTSALVYVFDVSATNRPSSGEEGVFEWIDNSVVNWYRQQSQAFTTENGGKPLPAMAFFHIPFPEFSSVAGKPSTFGSFSEGRPLPAHVSSNLFVAMKESKDVMGAFVGHQHNNNYIGYLDGISLGFGQTSGRQVYGEKGAGARVFELYEGERKFDSWIVKLYDNSRENDTWTPAVNQDPRYIVSYPTSFDEERLNAGKISMTTQAENIKFKLVGKGNVTVDWGDGSPIYRMTLEDNQPVEVKHRFTKGRTRSIVINGEMITELECENSELIQLNVKHAPELEVLWCGANLLSHLDLTQNTQLRELYCQDNELQSLDLKHNGQLVRLNCAQNLLKELDLSSNVKLDRMDSYENPITALDLSKNTVIHYVVCSDMLLGSEALDNLFHSLHRGDRKGKVFIGGNPGVDGSNRQIATEKGWGISLRY